MAEPLTAEEIDELVAKLRTLHGRVVAEGWVLANAPVRICRENAEFLVAAYDLTPRLLDELEHTRKVRSAVGACPPEHPMEHAAWCGGCCAKFDPRRMVLVHAVDCKIRGHERAER